MSWVSPIGHSDPDNKWNNEPYLYDEDITTSGDTPDTGFYIELTVPELFCNKVRIFAVDFEASFPFPTLHDPDIDIDVYYSTAWHNIWSGVITASTWVEKGIGSMQSVTKARIKFNVIHTTGYVAEFGFWKTHSSLADTNTIIRTYLLTPSAITNPLIALLGGVLSPRLYCPRLPENATLPAISFFTRGGFANRFRKSAVSPSVQFDCWADNLIDAREIYRALYDALHSIGNANITIAGTTYYIIEAREEVQGQDLVDVDIPNYFRVLTFYQITIRDDL